MRPLAIDLFVGTFGFSAGWLELGGRVIGFDIEHLPHHGPVPDGAELVLQDVRTLSGAQFKDASLIVASPPCPEFSFMAMPWRRSKQIAAALRGEGEFPSGYRASRTIAELTALFDCCFRLQREASEAAGHHIPLVVENVKGAQPWVGKAAAHYGSFYLFGDVPALMPFSTGHKKLPYRKVWKGTSAWTTGHLEEKQNSDGSWFAIGSPGQKETGRNPVNGDAVKMQTAGAGLEYGGGFGWDGSAMRTGNSKCSARRAASAMIARIPLELSRHIARCYWPGDLP